jgi:hypothetical protein
MECEFCKKIFKQRQLSRPSRFCSRKCQCTVIGRIANEERRARSKLPKAQRIPLIGNDLLDLIKITYDKHVLRYDNLCWSWKGGTTISGYGRMQPDRKSLLAHRVSWMIYKGEIPPSLNVLHKCDNPRCSNPDHLFLGTQSDNVKDMISKNRSSIYKNLDKKKVLEIKSLLKSKVGMPLIADSYGISLFTVKAIKYGLTWKNVN